MLRGRSTVAETLSRFRQRISSNAFSSDAQRMFLVQTCLERTFGAWLLELLRALRGTRDKGRERLDTQAAIQVRRQERTDPAQVFLAALQAVLAAPKRDNGDQPRFMVCDHDETSGEPGYLP